jgi:hypothetical protein
VAKNKKNSQKQKYFDEIHRVAAIAIKTSGDKFFRMLDEWQWSNPASTNV